MRARADFSGRWALKEEVGDKPVEEPAKNGVTFPGGEAGEGGRSRGRSSGGRSGGGIAGLPLEAVGDARRLAIADDGFAVRIEYPTGRKRVLYTDGEERELDDGDGPAKVIANRKGAHGETIVVSSSWSEGSTLAEVWNVGANPGRLTITGKTGGVRTYRYTRIYEPAPDPPLPSPTPAGVRSAPAPTLTPSPAPVPSEAAAGMKPECSIRPPRLTSPGDLRRLARISAADAEARAVASAAPKKVASIISSDVEVDDGCLVWPFDLRLTDEKGVLEVLIDAGDGKVLSSRHPED